MNTWWRLASVNVLVAAKNYADLSLDYWGLNEPNAEQLHSAMSTIWLDLLKNSFVHQTIGKGAPVVRPLWISALAIELVWLMFNQSWGRVLTHWAFFRFLWCSFFFEKKNTEQYELFSEFRRLLSFLAWIWQSYGTSSFIAEHWKAHVGWRKECSTNFPLGHYY